MSLLRSLMIPRVAIYHGFSHLSTCFNIPGTRAQAWMAVHTVSLTMVATALWDSTSFCPRPTSADCYKGAATRLSCTRSRPCALPPHPRAHVHKQGWQHRQCLSHQWSPHSWDSTFSVLAPQARIATRALQAYNTTAYRPSTTGRHSVVKRASMCVPAGARW